MILDKNGIKVDVTVSGRTLFYQVLDQSQEATEALQLLGHVHDPESEYTLKANKQPAINLNIKRFFVRGSNIRKHNQRVEKEFPSVAEAKKAADALSRLLDKVQMPEVREPEANQVRIGGAIVERGGTSHVRMCFINRAMAQHLQLTGHDHYPLELAEWEVCEPVITRNRHYNEHIGQVVDVLNKSEQPDAVVGHVINHHRVTPQQAKKARKALEKMFQEAYEGNYLVAMWRTVTGIRGPDARD